MSTDAATVSGMEIEGRASVRRANDPSVDDADSRREAARTRVSVSNLSGKDEGDWGVPRSDKSWWEKLAKTGRMASLERVCGVDVFPEPRPG